MGQENKERKMKVSKEQVKIVAFSDKYKIIGTGHKFPEGRFSDFVDSLQKGYITVTDARIYSVSTDELLYESKFMKLNLAYVEMIMPLSEFTERRSTDKSYEL